MVVISHKLFP